MKTGAILVVDADEMARRAKVEALRQGGFDVENMERGQSTIDLIEDSPPDLAVLGQVRLGDDGLEVCRMIKQRWPTVFVLQTLDGATDRARTPDGGADGYLAEPVELSELVADVKSLLRIRQVENELRQVVERNQVLIREVQHRTMNNLQLVISFLNLESRGLSDQHAKDRIRAVIQRVSALAAVHHHLYSRGAVDRIDFGSYVADLVKDIGNATGMERIVFRTQADPVWMEADRAIRLGLVVNELVTNAVKYAFAEGESGRISLSLHAIGAKEAVLTIEDDGRGFEAKASSGSTRSGLSLSQALTEQSDADLIRDTASRGTRWRIVLNDPEARRAERDAAR